MRVPAAAHDGGGVIRTGTPAPRGAARLRAAAVAASLAILAWTAPPARATDIVVVAKDGDPLAGGRVTRFGRPVVNDADQVAFPVEVSGLGTGLALATPPAAPVVLVAPGDDAPGTVGARFAAVDDFHLTLDDAGRVFFHATLVPGVGDADAALGNLGGWWIADGTTVVLVAREGSPVPSAGGDRYADDRAVVALGPTGDVLLGTSVAEQLTDPSRPDRILLGPPGALSLVDSGNLAVCALMGPGNAIWTVRDGEGSATSHTVRGRVGSVIQTLWRDGDPAPGGVGWVFTGAQVTGLNVHGDYAGTATAAMGGAPQYTGLFRGRITNRSVLVATGQTAPGTELPFTGILPGARIADSGHVLFPATVDSGGGPRRGLWVVLDSEHRHIVALEGGQVPGLEDGVTYADLLHADASINSTGHVMVRTAISGPHGEGYVLVASDTEGGVEPLVEVGGTVALGPADTRTLQEMAVLPDASGGGSGGSDGRSRWFDAKGRAALAVTFTDNSRAVLLASVTVVPPVPPVAVMKGLVAEVVRPARDRVTLTGRYPWQDALFDPRGLGGEVALGDPVGPVRVEIPDTGAGWRRARGRNAKWTWRSPKRALPRIVLTVNGKKETFSLRATRLDLEVLPDEGFYVSIAAGGASGTEVLVFRPLRPGRWDYRR